MDNNYLVVMEVACIKKEVQNQDLHQHLEEDLELHSKIGGWHVLHMVGISCLHLKLHCDQLKNSLGGRQLTLMPYALQWDPLLLLAPYHLEGKK